MTTAGSPRTRFRVLLELDARRSRIFVAVWVYALVATAASTVVSFKSLYPTPQARHSLAVGVKETVALLALSGRINGESLGDLVAWRLVALGGLAVGIFNVLLVVRHTRAEEESGRAELLLARGPARAALAYTALMLAAGTDVLIGVLAILVFRLTGLPWAGSAGLGLSWMLLGAAFAGIAALAAQLAETSRGANNLGVGAAVAFFVLRAAGDSGTSTSFLAWLSPIGWVERGNWFSDNNWAVLALPAGLAAVTGGAALARAGRRDLGAGWLRSRPGKAYASRVLSGPAGLAWRRDRGQILVWIVSTAALLAFAGASAPGIGDIFGGGPSRELLVRMGGATAADIAFLSIMIQVAGLVGAVVGVACAAGVAAQERSGQLELLLARRPRWSGRLRMIGGSLLTVAGGPLLLLAIGGAAAGLAAQLADPSERVVGKTVIAALAQFPAVLAVVAVALLFVAASPRWVAGAWAVLGAVFLLAELGPSLNLPGWVAGLAPFAHMPALESGELLTGTSAAIGAGALVVLALSAVVFGRRDLG